MSATVLFLDPAFRPLRIEHWTRAVTDLFLGKVEVVEHSRDRTIRTVEREMPMPAVVRVVRNFRRDRQRIKFSRANIYARDRFTCQFCGELGQTEDLTFDHVVPRSRGGKTTWENIVTCCVPCNSAKANRTPEQAGMRLIKRPTKPAYLPVVYSKKDLGQVPAEWVPYWTGTLEP
jgi:5-methylcytosine-specific restriction endonuclease McrA